MFFCLFGFFSSSQHLDHLQQLDNLEHSAHLYGQLTNIGQFTTFELLTIFGQFTTFELVTPFGSLQYLDNVLHVFSRVATKLQSAYVLAKGGRAYVSLSSLTR